MEFIFCSVFDQTVFGDLQITTNLEFSCSCFVPNSCVLAGIHKCCFKRNSSLMDAFTVKIRSNTIFQQVIICHSFPQLNSEKIVVIFPEYYFIQDAESEFKKGFNKRTSGTAFSEDVFSNELELKRRKISEENETNHSFVSEKKHDLAVFGNLPTELLQYHIALVLPLNWIFVSKLYYELAMNNLHRDPRIQNEDFFMRAMTLDNLHVVKIILERSAWLPKHHHMENGVVQAAKRGCVKVVQHFINNNILKLENPEYFYVSILKIAIRAGSYDVVEFLLYSGKVTRFSERSYSLLEIAAMQNQSNIVELLMANGVYDVYHMIFLLEKVIDSKCNVSIVRILFRATQHTLPSTEAYFLLSRAIKNNAYDVVEYLLDEVLAFVLHLGEEYMSLAVGMGAEKILGKLMNDSRIVWDPSILVAKAVMDGFPKIVRMLLDDPHVDANSVITKIIQCLYC
jgi:hypothetical protein